MSFNSINEGILNLHYDNNLLYSNISLKLSGKGFTNIFNNNYDYNGIGLQLLNNSINNKELNIINTSNLYNSNFSILNIGINNENIKIKSIYSNNLINLLNINNNININSNSFSLGKINNTSNFNINGNIFLNSNLIFNNITINSTILNNSNILNFKDTSININSSNLIINNNLILGANIYKTDGTLYITEDILNFINTQWSNINNSSNIYYNKGNIGIGISTIISSLDISSSLSNNEIIITLQNNESNNNFIFKKDNFNNGILWNFENNDLIFGTSNRERLRIKNFGNIGIGTSNPQSLLDIRTNVFLSGLLLKEDGSSFINIFWSNLNNNLYYNFGNIGINNNNPSSLLDINNGNLILNNGNLGIGINNPISQLHLSSSNINSDTILRFTDVSTDFTSNDGLILKKNITHTGLLWNFENIDLFFGTSNIERLRIKNSGNIGIGTTNPQTLLDIRGNIILTGLLLNNEYNSYINTLWKSNLNNRLYYNQGNIGINSINPSNKLDINNGNLIINNGNLGIGTNNPISQLHLSTSNSNNNIIYKYNISNILSNLTFISNTNDAYISFLSGTNNITFNDNIICDILVVGGGGGGGSWYVGGGGGGGEVKFISNYLILSGINYNITIGNGGVGGLDTGGNENGAKNGESTIFNDIIASGGGAGGTFGGPGAGDGKNGACGGGAGYYYSAGTGNSGKNGGSYSTSPYARGGGGGGMGTAGSDVGGDGVEYNITGVNIYYGGGGGAGSDSFGYSGGSGGGGRGGGGNNNGSTASSGTNGVPNTGGGGGGAGGNSESLRGGNGGSGIVIIRLKNIYNNIINTSLILNDFSTGYNINNGLILEKKFNNSGFLWNYENNDLIFGTSNQERLRIKNNSNIGIGISNPIGLLDIRGNMCISGKLERRDGSSVGNLLWSQNNNNLYYNLGNIGINNNIENNINNLLIYPPKQYTSFISETTTTIFNKNVYYQTLTLNNDNINYGSGIYLIYSSSTYSDYTKELLFNYNYSSDTGAHWYINQYNSSGDYNGNNYISNDINYKGDWIIIKFPEFINLAGFSFVARNNLVNRAPGLWRCYGSSNGIDYYIIKEASNEDNNIGINSYIGTDLIYTKLINSYISKYNYIGFTINKLAGSDTILNFNQIKIYGIKNNPESLLEINNGNIIINNGNLGIGRTNPQSHLHLYSNNINFNKYTYNLSSNIYSNLTFIPNTNDAYISFTSGTNNITFTDNIISDILIVGGGGSGGVRCGGGGGAGAVIYLQNQNLISGTYTINVGKGGDAIPANSTSGVNGNNGNDTFIIFNSNNIYLAKGGGGGAGDTGQAGKSGGSSGGGPWNLSSLYSSSVLTTNIPIGIYGNIGGKGGNAGSFYAGGGGGGANQIGGNFNISTAGKGGDGIIINITGSNIYYGAGGGGGIGSASGTAGLGGLGGGGNGTNTNNNAGDGLNNTGSGGGGSGFNGSANGASGAGGSGVVIIRIRNIYEVFNNNISIILNDFSTGYNSNNGLILQKNNSNNGILWNYENKDLIFGTSNQERFRIKNNSNIGIGTTNPQDLLDIRGNLYISGNLAKLDGSSVGNLLWTQQNNNLYYNEGDIGIGTNNPLNKLNINNGNIIINNGNLGIGTNNPISQIHLYSSNINNDIKIQLTDNSTQNRTNNIKPWAMYFAEDYNNINQLLLDSSDNNRHARCSGNIIKQTSSGNGASASISYIYGDTSSTISFPTGSIPENFTILSLTRYNGTTRRRILQSQSGNWIHGYWNGYRGIAYYEGWKTQSSSSIGTQTDWLCFIGKNSGTTPNNILIDGVGYGTETGGSGGDSYRLGINLGTFNSESSDWALSCVIIWDKNLTYENMLLFNSLINDYIKKGINIKNIILSLFINQGLALIKNNDNNCLLINYENNDLIFGTSNQERFRIKNSGYIGIGNSFPQDLLDIRGNFFISGTLGKLDGSSVGNLLWSQNNNNLYYNLGNIGINRNIQNDISKLLEYPPKTYNSFTNETTITFLGKSVYYQKITLDNTNINYGIGDYEIYSSSSYYGYHTKHLLFNKNNNIFEGFWNDFQYNNGNYTGSEYIIDDGYKGEWIIIKFPEFINLAGFTFTANPDSYYRDNAPGNWRCYGSSDGINFYKIEEASNEITNISVSEYIGDNYKYTKIIKSLIPKYNYIGFTINKLVGNRQSLIFIELIIYAHKNNPESLLEINNDNFIINNGNLGIGINNPISQLHLSSNINSDIILRFSDSFTGFSSNDGLILEKDVSQTGLLWNFENSDLIFGTFNQERLRIKNNGNIGIGINNPNNILSINSNISSQELLLKNINSSNIIDNKINITSNILINYSNRINIPNLSVYALTTSLNSKEIILSFSSPLSRNIDTITLSVDNTTLFIDNNVLKIKNPERWTIVSTSNIYNNNSGNVGIGTTSPTQIFQIGNNGRLRIANNNNDYTLIGTENTDTNENPKIIIYGNNNLTKQGSIEYYSYSKYHNFLTNTNNSLSSKFIGYYISASKTISFGTNGVYTSYPSLSLFGDLRLSGNLLKNNGTPFITRNIWTFNSSNIYYNNGSVAIGKNTNNTNFKLEINSNCIIGDGLYSGYQTSLSTNYNFTPLSLRNTNYVASFFINDKLPILHLCRDGNSTIFGSRATFKICKYEYYSSINNSCRTRLDLDLSHDSYDDSNIITIRSDKYFGINNNNPQSILDVGGNIILSGNILNSSGTNYLFPYQWIQNGNIIYNNTNIGISNLNPLSKLHVSGNIKLSGRILNNNNVIFTNITSNELINPSMFFYDSNNNLNISNFTLSNTNYIQPSTSATINTINNFSYIQFTNNTNITFNTLTIADLLIVGAGGNGGMGNYSGGGGAGEVIYYPNFLFNTGLYSFNIGIRNTNPTNRISKITYNNNDIIVANGGGNGADNNYSDFSISGSGTYSSLTFISDTNDAYISFTSGTNSISFTNNIICDILIVGGGGAGGGDIGGGGGAGGIVYQTNVVLNSGSYEIIVGNGGIGSTGNTSNNNVNGNNGYPSQIKFNNNIFTYNGISFEGKGGGGGGNYNNNNATAGNNGGCGGGGSENNNNSVSNGGNATQGNTYFNGITNVSGGYSGYQGVGVEPGYIGGGGGGAGGYSTIDFLVVGKGIQNNITGINTWYAAGGGAGSIGQPAGKGGSGIGGDGHRCNTNNSRTLASKHSGTDGTGSGGGGGGYYYYVGDDNGGGSGGSGIVIIRIKNARNIARSGGSGGGGSALNTGLIIDYSISSINNAFYSSLTNIAETNDFYISFTSGFTSINFNKQYLCDILLVGGGGGGGFGGGGGGGSGAVVYTSNVILSGQYYIDIGIGGTGGINDNNFSSGNNGYQTSIYYLNTTNLIYNAIGGGGGAAGNGGSISKAKIGGSGGGGGFNSSDSLTLGANSTSNIVNTNGIIISSNIPIGTYGNNGGNGIYRYVFGGYTNVDYNMTASGGGGGAGNKGKDAELNTNNLANGGNGGDGRLINITGINTYYGGGGGGGSASSGGSAGSGGQGGGGNGGKGSSGPQNGIANTGGGGGGSGYAGAISGNNGGSGGSGIVIIRIKFSNPGEIGYDSNNILFGGLLGNSNSTYSLITSGKSAIYNIIGGNGGSALSTGGYTTNITGTTLTLGVGGTGATNSSVAINGSTFGSGGSGNGGLGANGVIIIRYSTLPLKNLNITTNNININNLNCYCNISTYNNVGLLKNSPGFPLDINSSSVGNTFTTQIGLLQSSGSTTSTSLTQTNILVKANGSILTSSVFIASSDERIKKNINDINDNSALDKILKIEPKTYNYIDYISKGNKNVFGFIAQQINEYIPEAITIKKEYIPNIYKNGYINNNNIICNENLSLNINDDIRIISEFNGDNNYIITDIISSNIFKINKELYNCRCLIYGTKVKDFHTLDKNYIYTLNVCATQELYKLSNTNQEKLDNIKNKINQIKEIIYNSNL